MHVPCWRIAVFARVEQQGLPLDSREATEGTETGRTTADNDGIVGGIVGGSFSGGELVNIGDDPGKGKGQAMEEEEPTRTADERHVDRCD